MAADNVLLVHIQRDITCRDRFFSYREMETSSTSFRRGKLNGSAHRLNVCLTNRQAQSGAVGKISRRDTCVFWVAFLSPCLPRWSLSYFVLYPRNKRVWCVLCSWISGRWTGDWVLPDIIFVDPCTPRDSGCLLPNTIPRSGGCCSFEEG